VFIAASNTELRHYPGVLDVDSRSEPRDNITALTQHP
jgi:hypothetical protein